MAERDQLSTFSDLLAMTDAGIPVTVNPTILTIIEASLAETYKDVSRERILETIASLAREDSFRVAFNEKSLLKLIIPYLSSPESAVQLQALRIIGNLCYENDEARKLLLSNGGCKHLVNLIEKWTSDDFSNKFRYIVCGCVLNVLADNEPLTKEFSVLNIEEAVTGVLHCTTSDDVVEMALKLMSCIVEQNVPSVSAFLKHKSDKSIGKLLNAVTKNEAVQYAGTLLDLLHSLADHEEWKVVVTESNWLPALLGLKDHDLLKRGADITVLVLSSDSCMKQIMDEGNVVQLAKQWMEESDSLYLKATGALFIANMARSGDSCSVLVESGILQPLMDLLGLDPSLEGAANVFQSSLSALRNLAIPVPNKLKLFEMGIADGAIKHLKSKSPMVQFKVLGTLRLMSDKQESICDYILSNVDTIQTVCGLCAHGSHLEKEGCRLLASLVKYSNSQATPSKIVCEVDGAKWLVHLLSTDNALMINEGLVALAIVCSKHDRQINEKLATANVVPDLLGVFERQSVSGEVVSNGLALLLHLAQDDGFSVEIANSATFMSEMLPLFKKHEMQVIVERAHQLEKHLSRHMKSLDSDN